ncbi:PREDICTED: insulin-like growth factor 2 mRNA-binding protein 3 isoform X4 [Branchiostoma belcheri]|uniref:Insulin-like growth factor 2 mRNA-binding protein 3 isoform X4 n=1 Tax=Branchiostoma belcheri TaxID=7741 RepID=A0A6P4Z916_BRABE|nr:PREDICTED: insulin-like growth factor 2 mRNA-binding protein 3 isoform X4 [Branchiostoma belcheri]
MATKLYFGNLSPDITLDMLKNLLLEYDVPIVPDTVQLKNHFAFVEVQDNATAEETIRKLHGYNFHGSVMTVEHSVQRNRGRSRTTKVSISNIPNQATDEDIRHLAATFGTIKECHTHEMNETKTANVTYEAPEQAAQAVNHLRGHKYCEGSYLDVNYVNENGGRNYYRNRYNPGGGNQGYGGYGNRIQGQSQDFPLRMLVPNVMVGAIIGKGGQTIRTITGATKAKVDVHRKENMGQEKPITIYGSPEACSEACRKILEIMQQESNATTAQSTDDERSDPPSSEDVPLKLLAHNSLVGRLIGKAGVTLKKIMQDSNTRISISNMQELTLYNWERTVTISGEVNAQCKAEKFIMQKLRASYEADMQNITQHQSMFPGLNPMAMLSGLLPGLPNPNSRGNPYNGPMTEPNAMPGNPAMFPGILPPAAAALAMQQQMQQPQPSEKSDLWVPGGVVGALIGPGGQNIRSASRQANATIKIAPADQSAQGQGERKVSITGSPDAQWKVQWWVFTKVGQEAYAGNDVVVLRAEIPVPSNMVGRIIGKRGASVQGLQKNTSARIEVPRNKQGDENGEVPVTIVGNFYAVQSAQRQIRKLVTQAQQQQQGQGPMQRRQPGPPKHVNMQ